MSTDYFNYLFADLKKKLFYLDFTRKITTYDFGEVKKNMSTLLKV